MAWRGVAWRGVAWRGVAQEWKMLGNAWEMIPKNIDIEVAVRVHRDQDVGRVRVDDVLHVPNLEVVEERALVHEPVVISWWWEGVSFAVDSEK